LPNTTSKKLGLDKKIMLTSSIVKWILRKETKLGCTLYKVHSKYKRRRKEVKNKIIIHMSLPKSLKVHLIFHVAMLKQIVQNLSR
jgi:hypothetical protein